MLLKSPLEEIFMTHLYSTHDRFFLTCVDIGDGILRAGSYSSSFCPLVGSGMHHFRFKRIWQIYSIIFVYDILFPKVFQTLLYIVLMSVKCLFKQVLEGVEYLHKNDIIHRFFPHVLILHIRDLKISNLLLNSRGILKIGMTSLVLTHYSRLWNG